MSFHKQTSTSLSCISTRFISFFSPSPFFLRLTAARPDVGVQTRSILGTRCDADVVAGFLLSSVPEADSRPSLQRRGRGRGDDHRCQRCRRIERAEELQSWYKMVPVGAVVHPCSMMSAQRGTGGRNTMSTFRKAKNPSLPSQCQRLYKYHTHLPGV